MSFFEAEVIKYCKVVENERLCNPNITEKYAESVYQKIYVVHGRKAS